PDRHGGEPAPGLSPKFAGGLSAPERCGQTCGELLCKSFRINDFPELSPILHPFFTLANSTQEVIAGPSPRHVSCITQHGRGNGCPSLSEPKTSNGGKRWTRLPC